MPLPAPRTLTFYSLQFNIFARSFQLLHSPSKHSLLRYILGYLGSTGRLYLCDKDIGVVSYQLQQSVLEYQTAVMRGDLEAADAVLPTIPQELRTRVAHFLEKQGFKEQALVVSVDVEHRFELSVSMHRLDIALECAKQIDAVDKWKQLGEVID